MPHISTIKNIVDNAFVKVIGRNKFLSAANISNTSLQDALSDALRNTPRGWGPSKAILSQADTFEMKASLEEIGLKIAGDHIERNEKLNSG
ncbi:MAG: hypothetical protein ACI9S8_000402 [Chlamydiales bacterium]|jgi:hypothetical protein